MGQGKSNSLRGLKCPRCTKQKTVLWVTCQTSGSWPTAPTQRGKGTVKSKMDAVDTYTHTYMSCLDLIKAEQRVKCQIRKLRDQSVRTVRTPRRGGGACGVQQRRDIKRPGSMRKTAVEMGGELREAILHRNRSLPTSQD